MDFMSHNLDITLLRTFVAVAERSSMTAAANALHLTQSAVSQQVGRLEDLCGELFSRDRRALRLTATGERLLGKVRRLLALNDELWADIEATGVEGEVRLGAPYDLLATCLGPVFKQYVDAHPQVQVVLTAAASPDLLSALGRGELDLALVEEPVGPSRGERLAVDRLVWVGAQGGAAHLKTPLPVSMVADTCAFRPAVLEALAAHGLDWRTVFENGSVDATAATVRSDLAISVWLASTVAADLQILSTDAGLPLLPAFSINLHLPAQVSTATVELARLLRNGFAPVRQAAPAALNLRTNKES